MITLQQAYEKALDLAIEHGPRTKKDIQESLKKLKEEYKKLDTKKKKYFDQESLTNPYLDSRIENGDPKTKLQRVLVGIDIHVGEILLAHELSKDKKRVVDAVIAHHPEGRSLIDLTRVMSLQEDIGVLDGVPINIVEKLMQSTISDLDRRLHPVNHYQVPQAAKLLGMPLACFHTFADNQCYWFLKNYLTKKKSQTLDDILEALMELPEYQHAKKMGNGPTLFTGSPNSKVGKISFSGITGGTSGSKDIYEKMSAAGIGTIISMHIPEDHRKLAEKYHINIVISGHMASDSLGVNILMDELEKEKVEILECGGFMRVSRVGKKMPW